MNTPSLLTSAFAWPTWVDQIPLPPPFNKIAVASAAALVVLLVLRAVLQRFSRMLRSRRPAAIHPNLQKYNVDHAELDRRRKELAARIIATSTGGRLAGFRIVRQVEAVFVEGYRTPEEAIVALKAGAAERGANGILNVQTDRTSAGRCTASGDAVVVAPLVAKMPERKPAATGGAIPPMPATPPKPMAPPLPGPPPLPPRDTGP